MTTSSPRDLADLRESIARAIWQSDMDGGEAAPQALTWDDEPDQGIYRANADAVLAVVGTHVEVLEAQVERVRALADQWNETPDYTASDYDRGRVEQRHDMTLQLLAALAPQPAATEEGRS